MYTTMRSAFFIQTGIQHDADAVKHNVEKQAAPNLRLMATGAAVGYKLYKTKTLKFRYKRLGDWTLSPGSASVTWGFSW